MVGDTARNACGLCHPRSSHCRTKQTPQCPRWQSPPTSAPLASPPPPSGTRHGTPLPASARCMLRYVISPDFRMPGIALCPCFHDAKRSESLPPPSRGTYQTTHTPTALSHTILTDRSMAYQQGRSMAYYNRPVRKWIAIVEKHTTLDRLWTHVTRYKHALCPC